MRRPRPRSRSSSRIRSTSGALVLAVLLAAATPAFAQDSSTEAAAAFDQGTQYFERGQYALALESFRTAYRLRAHPAILLNLATCYDRLGRSTEAVTEYYRYRRLRGSGIEPERRRFVDDALRRLAPQVALAWVTLPSPDAQVAIDGTLVEIGEDPLVLPPGIHRVESRAQDGRYTSMALRAVGGQTHNVTLRFRGSAPSQGPPTNAFSGDRPANGGGPPPGPGPGPQARSHEPPPPSEIAAPEPDERRGSPPPPEASGWDPSLRWIGVGATLVFGGIMIFTASRTLSLSDEYDRTRDESVKQDGLTYRAVTEFVFFPATLLAAGFTVLAFVFAEDGEAETPAQHALIAPLPGGFVLGARGTF